MDSENKVQYFCINSSNEFKIMNDMHQALVRDNFQKILHRYDEDTYGKALNMFFARIIQLKTNVDLYAQNLNLLEKYLSMNQIKEIKDISKEMNFLLNYNFNGEFFLTKEIAENIGPIIFYGFSKLKSKFKQYLIKSYADLKEKLEIIKFNQIDLLNEYYNQELLDEKNADKNLPKYIFRKEPYTTNDGKVFCKEHKTLPNEIILLINKLQYVKTLTFKIDDINKGGNNTENTKETTNKNSNDKKMEILLYIIILLNVQWLLPNIILVNFDLANSSLSNALIDLMSLKISQDLQSINIFEKKTFYTNERFSQSDLYNYEMLLKPKEKQSKKDEDDGDNIESDVFQVFNEIKRISNQKRQEKFKKEAAKNKESKKDNKKVVNKKNKKVEKSEEKDEDDINYDEDLIDDEEKKLNTQIIREIYNDYVNRHIKELDMTLITASFIRLWEKLPALNIKCPDIFNNEIKGSFLIKSIKIINDLSFFNLLNEVRKLNMLNIEFNCLDYINFAKILGLINANVNLCVIRLILFGNDKYYSPGGIYKLLYDLNESNLAQVNKEIINKKGNQNISNTDFEEVVLNYYFLEKLQNNLEILFSTFKHHRKTLNEFVSVINLPSLLINNDRYNLSFIKFIINILIYLIFDKHEVRIIKIISPLLKFDSRKYPLLNDLFNKITEVQYHKNLLNLHTLYLQFDFCHMENITKLITVNLNTINIGNLDIPTFYAIAEKITSEEFLNESKLMNVKIILKENIYKYDENMRKHIVAIFKYYAKNMATMELITKLKVKYEDLVEIMNEIKKTHINKYLITFHESSKTFIDKVTSDILPEVTTLNKTSEEKLHLLTKLIITNDNEESEENDEEKKKENRKKIFKNIKMLYLDRKEINFDLN